MATEPVSTVSTTDTATPQEPDWTLAQLLYTKGDPLDKVCRQANVTLSALKKRAHRKGWTAAKQAVHIHTQTITRHAAKEVANSVRPKLHGHLNPTGPKGWCRPSRLLAAGTKESLILLDSMAQLFHVEHMTNMACWTCVPCRYCYSAGAGGTSGTGGTAVL